MKQTRGADLWIVSLQLPVSRAGLNTGDPSGGDASACLRGGRLRLSGFIPALVEKRLPLTALITIPPRSKDTVVIDGA